MTNKGDDYDDVFYMPPDPCFFEVEKGNLELPITQETTGNEFNNPPTQQTQVEDFRFYPKDATDQDDPKNNSARSFWTPNIFKPHYDFLDERPKPPRRKSTLTMNKTLKVRKKDNKLLTLGIGTFAPGPITPQTVPAQKPFLVSPTQYPRFERAATVASVKPEKASQIVPTNETELPKIPMNQLAQHESPPARTLPKISEIKLQRYLNIKLCIQPHRFCITLGLKAKRTGIKSAMSSSRFGCSKRPKSNLLSQQ